MSPVPRRFRLLRLLRARATPLLSACGLCLACSNSEPASPAETRPATGDILLISIDTLRSDHLGLYGYPRATSPNIDHWFGDGAIFERAYAAESSTPPSVVSVLSGLLPQQHRVRLYYQLLPQETRLVSELLPPAYQTAAFVSNIVLTDEALGAGARFDYFDDFVDERVASYQQVVFERDARKTTDAVLLWLREARDSSRPLFLWVHYNDPHGPYDPPASWAGHFSHSGRIFADEGKIPTYQRLPDSRDALDYIDRYDEEIAFMDEQVGRLLTAYAQTRDPDRALIIFTADHGESLMERLFWFAHGFQVFEELVRVPLMLRGAGVSPGRRQGLVSGIDVVPTMLHFAGVSPPSELSGFELMDESSLPAGRVVFAEAGGKRDQWRAVIEARGKHVVRLERGTRAVLGRRFYDLRADPGEKEPQRGPRNAALERLLALAASDPDPGGQPSAFEKGERLVAPKISPRADAEALRQLRALGYVE